MIEVKEPIATEYAMTPMSMSTMQKIYSDGLFEVISPYPTVVIVVIIK